MERNEANRGVEARCNEVKVMEKTEFTSAVISIKGGFSGTLKKI